MVDHDGQDTTQESLEIGMQILHGEAFADFEMDAFSGGAIPIIPDFAVTITNLQVPGARENAIYLLSRVFPPDHPVMLLTESTGSSSGVFPLAQLGDVPLDDNDVTTLVVAPQSKLDAVRSPHTLQYLAARLRDEDGCPWDRKQTHATLRDAVINEAYEVLDAIDDEDWENLAEELGDLFLIVAMQAQIAEEAGEFTLEDVYEHVTAKIIRRHPHVFGDVEAGDPDAVVETWNAVKAQEKADLPPRREKARDGQPRSMPALTRAARAVKKHPVPDGGVRESAGDALLRLVSDIVANGDDPDRLLLEALERHLASVDAT